MKVLLVNTYDRGGAANSCLRLHMGLLRKNIDSTVLLRTRINQTPKTIVFTPSLKENSLVFKIKNKIKHIRRGLKFFKSDLEKELHFLKERSKDLEMFSFPQSDFDITDSLEYKNAKIINLHWVAGFVDFQSFFKKNSKPVVWTLHDMNPFSGGEHFEETFSGVDNSGKPIMRYKTVQEESFFFKNLKIKKKALEGVENITIVAPSMWLVNEAKKSELFKNRSIFHIPNGLDSKVFKPMARKLARNILGLPEEKTIVLFVSDLISKNRKGFSFLKSAFKELNDDRTVLCAVGPSETVGVADKIFYYGSIDSEERMVAAYSAADVVIVPSLMDNLPNTALEAIMCGTPVIGFPVGGLPEIIQDSFNGFICDEISVSSLKETLAAFLSSSKKFDRIAIREQAIAKYDQKIQAEKYIELFNNIMKFS